MSLFVWRHAQRRHGARKQSPPPAPKQRVLQGRRQPKAARTCAAGACGTRTPLLSAQLYKPFHAARPRPGNESNTDRHHPTMAPVATSSDSMLCGDGAPSMARQVSAARSNAHAAPLTHWQGLPPSRHCPASSGAPSAVSRAPVVSPASGGARAWCPSRVIGLWRCPCLVPHVAPSRLAGPGARRDQAEFPLRPCRAAVAGQGEAKPLAAARCDKGNWPPSLPASWRQWPVRRRRRGVWTRNTRAPVKHRPALVRVFGLIRPPTRATPTAAPVVRSLSRRPRRTSPSRRSHAHKTRIGRDACHAASCAVCRLQLRRLPPPAMSLAAQPSTRAPPICRHLPVGALLRQHPGGAAPCRPARGRRGVFPAAADPIPSWLCVPSSGGREEMKVRSRRGLPTTTWVP